MDDQSITFDADRVGHVTLVAVTRTTTLIPVLFKYFQLIWRSGMCGFYLLVSDLQMSYRDVAWGGPPHATSL